MRVLVFGKNLCYFLLRNKKSNVVAVSTSFLN